MEYKINIPRPLLVVAHEVIVARRTFFGGITREHALQAHTYAFHIVNGGPSRAIEEVEANDAVGVDVRVPGYGVRGCTDEDYFGGLRYHMALVVFLVVDGAKRMWRRRIMEAVRRSEWGMGGGEQLV